MTNDSHLFKTSDGPGRLPLFEGKMIWQFSHEYAEPRFWVVETEGRKAVMGRTRDHGQKLDYQTYRLGYRDIAANTNERTLISSMIPPTFHGNKIPTVRVYDDDGAVGITAEQQLFLSGVWNSFVLDWMIRGKVTTTLNFFHMFQLPIPRLLESDETFEAIVSRSARLTCTREDFDDLARELGIGSHKDGVTDETERRKLRAELDAIIAHLYGLTEEEFAYMLTTFPLVSETIKVETLNAYRDYERGLIK